MFYQKIYLKDHYPLNTEATLEIFIPDFNDDEIQKPKRGILITPGGGYSFVSKREGDPVACEFMSRGYNAFVLRYTICPTYRDDYYPIPYLEVMASMDYIRKHADELRTLKDKITIMGFSAGGHLAASYPLVEHDKELRKMLNLNNEDLRPNSLVLSYAVLDFHKYHHSNTRLMMSANKEELINKLSVPQNVDKTYPPTFIWTTFEDDIVPYENSSMMDEALTKHNVYHKYVLFPKGWHGLSLVNKALNPELKEEFKENAKWVDLADEFLRNL